MITLMAEAAVRSLGLTIVVALCITAIRVRSPHVEKTAWVTVLIASLTMPILMLMPVRPPIAAGASDLLLILRPSAGTGARVGAGWASAATALYCLIALVLLGRHVVGLARVWYIRRNARALKETWTAGLDVRATSQLPVPATFGSTILLPLGFAAWSDEKLGAVISHERSHVIEKDSYLLWLSHLNTCLFWFNPMAWWLHQKIAALAENTGDQAGLSAIGDRAAYAEILLGFANERFADGAVAPMARSTVADRVERIISGAPSPNETPLSRRWLAVAALLPVIAASAIPLHASPLGGAQSSEARSHTDAVPRITSWGGLENLEKYYPPEAKRSGIEGVVELAVTLDPRGRATDTLILSEDPPDMGFGAAASALAHSMEYANPTGQQAQFTFRVKFDLPHSTAPTTTDSPTQGPR